jgi:hypothetical protein
MQSVFKKIQNFCLSFFSDSDSAKLLQSISQPLHGSWIVNQDDY